MQDANNFASETESDSTATSDKRVVAALRQMIMDGKLGAGDRVSEVSVSGMFEVSRTPARLALRALEVEGLIKKRDGRGYTVLKFDTDNLERAYDVRGVLEGLAASTLARQGIDPCTADRLRRSIREIDDILTGTASVADRVNAYQEANILFHETIMSECGNEFIGFAIMRLQNFPLVSLGTVVFNDERVEEEIMRLRFGNMQHNLILDAIVRGDAFRAESLMREHANQIPRYTNALT